MVDEHDVLDIEKFRRWRDDLHDAEFILEDGKYYVGREVEKMSKSKYNVVNPDDIVEQYGADTLRMYEMFLGPIEIAKPWNTAGLKGVYNFLKKFWRLYHDSEGNFRMSDTSATEQELQILHKTIKKVEDDILALSFNTAVSAFIIAVNELTALKTDKKEILEPLIVLISPFAPHMAEELWHRAGRNESVEYAPYPQYDEKYLKAATKEYPVSFNGKVRFKLQLPADATKEEIEKAVMQHEKTAKYLEGKTPKKVIVVPGRIVNIVV
jgi:leucyl-tRNA synthetase